MRSRQVVCGAHILRRLNRANGEHSLCLPVPGTAPLSALTFQIDQLAACLKKRGIFLDIVLVRPSTSRQATTKLAAENARLLRRFSSRAAPGGSFKTVPSLRDAGLLYNVKARVMPTSSYRGDMEVAPNLRFKVRERR